MLKVVGAEVAHLSRVFSDAVVIHYVLQKDGSAMMDGPDNNLLGQGKNWKSQRVFMKTGMLDTLSARDFVPRTAKAAQFATKGDPYQSHDLNRYLNLCAFDMFISFMFGKITECAGSSTQKIE